MKTRSIYKEFYIKLIVATSLLIITLSFVFLVFTKNSFYENIQENLLLQAKQIEKGYISEDKFKNVQTQFQNIELVKELTINSIEYNSIEKNYKHYVELLFPLELDKAIFLKITKDITLERELLYSNIFKNFFVLAIPGFILLLIYSLIVSKSLLKPIIQINKKLANMDEKTLSQIDTKDLPIEFKTLANSINSLTNRILTYVKFKKELFIGVAHELKTPLAVMKLKNEVALKKERSIDEYKEILKLSIKQIDDMNIMMSSILDIGRTEGAQFEDETTLDLVDFLRKKSIDYKMLASQKNIKIDFISNISSLNIIIRKTLLNQILQNFVQNAIKFTPNSKKITISLKSDKEKVSLEVIDEGLGIDENIDLFAPFKRVGSSSGVGLGLYLAKIAADALNAEISIENRDDNTKGCLAKLILNL